MTVPRIIYFNRILHKNMTKLADIQTSSFRVKCIAKKLTSAILCGVMLFTTVACTLAKPTDSTILPEPTEKAEQTPTVNLPEYERETVLLKDIGDYTIVYPSEYTDYRKQDVEFLQKVIKNVTGASLNVISDLEDASGKEIIIASSKRKNGIEDAIEKFQSGLDYVVAVRNGNIVLGGNNFYADIRAIYDFTNNILGYNDIDNEQGEAKETLSGVNYYIYEEPPILITGSNFSVPAFTEQFTIRDAADAKFNMLLVEGGYADVFYDTEEELLDLIKWCARYSIKLMFRGESRNELLLDCPIIYSTYVFDEPRDMTEYRSIDETLIAYAEKYSQYGWKPFLNFMPIEGFIQPLEEWMGLFDSIPMISFDVYPGHSVLSYTEGHIMPAYEHLNYLARAYNKDLWVYIESYNIKNKNRNTSKMFRWQGYMALSFGAKNILYFEYGDASTNYTAEGDWSYGSLINWDYTKNDAWYDAQRFNEELLTLSSVYNMYESKGACTLNVSAYDINAYYAQPYEKAGEIVEDYIYEDEDNDDPYLLGFFDKKGNNKAHAFTIVNLSDISDTKYESDDAKYVKFKIIGENVTFYRNGKVEAVEKTDDGYYRVNMANGYCWFVTVD